MYKDHLITNKITGQRIRFIRTAEDTGGELLEMETVYSSFSDEPPIHYHPAQEEFFQVLSGELTVRIDADVKIYRTGAVIHIAPGLRHSMWNSGHLEARVNWKVYPAMDTANFLISLTALANMDRTNKKGIPSLPVMVFLLNKYKTSFRLQKPAMWLIRLLYLVFSPAYLLYPTFRRL